MSSIMRARNALPGRGEEAEVIGGPLRAEGCWTFNARDQMPRSSPLTAHPLTATAKNAPASTPPSRESGFVRCPVSAIRRVANKDCWEQPYPDELRLATVACDLSRTASVDPRREPWLRRASRVPA